MGVFLPCGEPVLWPEMTSNSPIWVRWCICTSISDNAVRP